MPEPNQLSHPEPDQSEFERIDREILSLRSESLQQAIDGFEKEGNRFSHFRDICACSRTLEHALDGTIRDFGPPPDLAELIALLENAFGCSGRVSDWDEDESVDEQESHSEKITAKIENRINKFRNFLDPAVEPEPSHS